MMIRSMDDFYRLWEPESKATLKIFNALSDTALDQKVYAEGRTVYTIAWHIVKIIGEMMEQAGLKIDAPPVNGQTPQKVLKICEAYERMSESLLKTLRKNWTDQTLNDEVTLFGQKWTRSRVLFALLVHQIHHRGQLTVLMRQAGLTVPGVYGPSREEWALMGMPPKE